MSLCFSKVTAALVLIGSTAVQGWSSSKVSACGLDWVLPTNHFDGVDDRGCVAYWAKIGEMDCGDDLKLPLYINFNSGREGGAPSPYLGQGWMLPLLECKFVQESEDRFVMIQPNGLKNLFLRAEPNGTVLNGSARWKGEIRGDTIVAWAPCGWKVVFAHGHVLSMTTPKSKQLDWVYEGEHVAEMRERGITILKVEYGPTGQASVVDLPGTSNRIVLAQEQRPRLHAVDGENVVVGFDSSLHQVTLATGQMLSYTFGTDNHMLSTLSINDYIDTQDSTSPVRRVKEMSWNTRTKLAAQDGNWTYQISAARTTGDSASIQRTDVEGKSEYWYYNGETGEEITQVLGSPKISKHFYTSGILSGMIRSIEYVDNPNSKLYKAYYDEQGRLIREVKPDSEVRRDFKIDKCIYTLYAGGKLVSTGERDLAGRPLVEKRQDGTVVVYTYNSDHTYKVNETHGDGYSQTLYYSPTGHLVNAKSSEGDWSLDSLHALLSKPLNN